MRLTTVLMEACMVDGVTYSSTAAEEPVVWPDSVNVAPPMSRMMDPFCVRKAWPSTAGGASAATSRNRVRSMGA